MSARPATERAGKAAREVSPLVLASALDHIAKSAAASRSQTRRIRWIESRALGALAGRDDSDLDLPKSPGPETVERMKLQRRVLLDALKALDEAYCRAGTDLTKEERHEDRQRLIAARAAIAMAEGRAS